MVENQGIFLAFSAFDGFLFGLPQLAASILGSRKTLLSESFDPVRKFNYIVGELLGTIALATVLTLCLGTFGFGLAVVAAAVNKFVFKPLSEEMTDQNAHRALLD